MKGIYKIGLFLAAIAVLAGCKQDTIGPLESSTNAPGKVSNVTVVNGPGKAELTYSLPSDRDLLYVKAVYSLASGRVMEVKASYYDSKLTVVGFGDTALHEVKLYAVNRSEVASEPLSVMVKPLENPIWGVFRSMEAKPDFGGIRIMADNPDKADVTIELMIKNNKGIYEPTTRNIYTSLADISVTSRGMDTLKKDFAVTVRDRWLNYTDTLYTTLTPLYETAIPKSGYRAVRLPSDVALHASTPLTGLWDNDTNGWPRVLMTSSSVLTQQWITFDIGVQALLSRIVIWDYPEYLNGRTYYYGGNLRDFEIWGSDNPPSDGTFNNWVKLGSFMSVKPSGTAYGVNSAEDIAVGSAGLNYTFDLGMPKVRYLRIVSNRNWQGTTFMAIGELQVYGDPR